jgi:hypothetical protein
MDRSRLVPLLLGGLSLRLHFRREAPAWEAEALIPNLLRMLRKKLPPAAACESEPLRWWQGVLRRSPEGLTEAVGRVRV